MGKPIKNIMNNIKYINIGCGLSKIERDNWCNIDISDKCKPDLVHDLRKGLPMFEDNSLEEVVANGVLEMILPNEEFVFVLNEIWRVLKPNGQLNGQVPSIDTRVLMLDPFDRRWFQEDTFNYWNVDEHCWKQFGIQYGFLAWHVLHCKTNDNGIICFKMSPAHK